MKYVVNPKLTKDTRGAGRRVNGRSVFSTPGHAAPTWSNNKANPLERKQFLKSSIPSACLHVTWKCTHPLCWKLEFSSKTLKINKQINIAAMRLGIPGSSRNNTETRPKIQGIFLWCTPALNFYADYTIIIQCYLTPGKSTLFRLWREHRPWDGGEGDTHSQIDHLPIIIL